MRRGAGGGSGSISCSVGSIGGGAGDGGAGGCAVRERVSCACCSGTLSSARGGTIARGGAPCAGWGASALAGGATLGPIGALFRTAPPVL